MSLFRAYDIRGIYGEDLTDDVARNLGKAFGSTLEDGSTIAVGHDVRLSGPALNDALVEGLTSAGVNVVDIGTVPTPLLYFAISHWKLDGGVMITGSHNPPEYNGFKLCRGTMTLYGPEIQEIKGIIEKGEFRQGSGGSVEQRDAVPDYLAYVKERIKLEKPIKLVIDAANGTAGAIAKKLFTDLGCELTMLYEEPDGRFPNHPADPTVDANMADLIAKVKDIGADLGLAYDGDSDRAGFVTDQGELIRGDQALILFSRDILTRQKGAPIIFEVKCSQALLEDIEAHGGEPVMYRTGHSFIKKKMKEIDAPLAGEMSGHFFFAENYYGFDDGIYASAKMAEIVAKSGKASSELLASLPHYVNTPELRVSVPEDKKFGIIEDVTKIFKERYGDKVIDVDGMRLQLPNGWGLVRASNTTPILVLRFEGKTQDDLDAIRKLVVDELWKYEELADGLCQLEKQ